MNKFLGEKYWLAMAVWVEVDEISRLRFGKSQTSTRNDVVFYIDGVDA